jgi:HEAT repeat protein
MRWTYPFLVLPVLLLSCNKKEEAWKAGLSNPFPEARIAAFKQLIEKVTPDDLEYLALAAKDMVPGVRMVAAEGLGKSRDGHALDLLSNLLMDPDEGVQVAAASAMGRNGSEKARKYLFLRFAKSRQPTRHAIVQALQVSGLPEPMKQAVVFEAKTLWEEARQTLMAPPSLAEQVSAVVRLGESGRSEAVELLLPFLKEKTPALISAAAEGLASLGAHAALPELEALAFSSNADVRKAGIFAVSSLQATRSIPLLIQLTAAEDETALLALEGLQRFPSSPEIDKAICEMAVQPGNPLLRFRAALALAQRAPCSPHPLFEQLSNPSLAETALLVLMRWPNAWNHEANKVWALLKSENLGLSALAANVLSQAYLQGRIEEKHPGHVAFILERIAFLSKREEPWIKSPLEDGFGVRVFEGSEDTERRRRQELLMKGIEARKEAQLKEMGKQASRPLLLPALAENLSEVELEQLAAFLKLASFLQPSSVEDALKRHANAPEVSLRTAALRALVRMEPAFGDWVERGIFDQDEKVRLAVAEALVQEGFEREKQLLQTLGKRAEDSADLLGVLSCKQLDEEGAQTLFAFLDKSAREASLAVRCLGRAKYIGAQDRLLLLLNTTTVVSKKAVIEALREMEAQSASKEIENQLFHESPEIREAAARVLRYFRVRDSEEMLEALREDYFKRVRQDGISNM